MLVKKDFLLGLGPTGRFTAADALTKLATIKPIRAVHNTQHATDRDCKSRSVETMNFSSLNQSGFDLQQ
jgi:hypothetical protein